MKDGMRDYEQMLQGINTILYDHIDLLEDVSYKAHLCRIEQITKDEIKSMATALGKIYTIAHGTTCCCGEKFDTSVPDAFNSMCDKILEIFNAKYFKDTPEDEDGQLWCVTDERWNAIFYQHYVFTILDMVEALRLDIPYKDLIAWYEYNQDNTKKVNMKNYVLLKP